MIWNCSDYSFDAKMPIVMGILNVTPDSFSDGGSYADADEAIAAGLQMAEQGAHIIDVGGESTRPGACPVDEDTELQRVLEVVRSLAQHDVCVSIDTRHARVARECVAAGASIINDVEGFRDPAMIEVAAQCDAGLVVMHMGGSDPQTMQQNTDYTDVVVEVRDWLADRTQALEAVGVDHARICVDPGPGFGKTASQCIELMRNLQVFVHLGYPVMCAVSRKSFIASAYGLEGKPATDRDTASAAEALMAVEQGASVVRAHNVPLTVETLGDVRPYVLLGLGCNVPLVAEPGEETEGKIAMLNKAIGDMCLIPDSQIVDISAFYESEPAYVEDQDTFINAVVLMRTGQAPINLLKYLQAIENSLGRVRTIANGPRTCDIDILDYQQYTCESEELTLPHPLLAERDFVVKPLLDILPGHVLSTGQPVTGEQVTVGKAHRL